MTTSPLQTKSSLFKSPLFWLLLATLLIRGAALFSSLDSFEDDPDQYMSLAENWREYGVFGYGERATAFRPPLYPWALKIASLASRRDDERRNDALEIDALEIDSDASNVEGTRARFLDDLLLSREASVALLHWILGVATVALVYLFARTLDFSPLFAALGAALVAVDPILLQQSRLAMTETFASFFAIAILNWGAFVLRRRTRAALLNYALFGVLLGLATLCRPAYLALAGLIFAYLTFVESRAFFSKSRGASILWAPCVFLVGLALVLLPWAFRNQRELGIFKATTTHGGYTLLLANNPELYEHYRTDPIWTFWNPDAFQARLASDYEAALIQAGVARDSKEAELFQDQWTQDRALNAIRSDRRTFLYSCFVRIGELWRFRPYELGVLGRSGVLALDCVAIFYALEAAAFLAGLGVWFFARKTKDESCRRSFLSSPWIWGWLLILSIQIPHLFYWTNMRMRAPLEVFLPLLSLWGVSKVYFVWTRKKEHRNYITI